MIHAKVLLTMTVSCLLISVFGPICGCILASILFIAVLWLHQYYEEKNKATKGNKLCLCKPTTPATIRDASVSVTAKDQGQCKASN
jgi:hypothetical protein